MKSDTVSVNSNTESDDDGELSDQACMGKRMIEIIYWVASGWMNNTSMLHSI